MDAGEGVTCPSPTHPAASCPRRSACAWWYGAASPDIVVNEVMSQQPQVWKLAVISWLGLWPTVTVMMWTLRPQIEGLPVALQTLLMTGLIVPIMTWVHVPLLTRLFRRWLRADLQG